MRRFRLPIAGLAALLVSSPLIAEPAPLIPAGTSLLEQDDTQQTPPYSIDDARRLQGSGEFAEAIDAWVSLAKDEPASGEVMFNLGYCLHAVGRLDEAIEVHARAAEFDQYTGIALYNLGCAYALQGKSDEALKALAASQENDFNVGERFFEDDDLVSLREDPRIAMFFDQHQQDAGSVQVRNESRFAKLAQRFAQKLAPVAQEAMSEMAPQAIEALGQQFPEMAPMIDQVAPMVMNKLQGSRPLSPAQIEAMNERVKRNAAEMQNELTNVVGMLSAHGQQMLKMIESQLQSAIANDPGLRKAMEDMARDPRFEQVLGGLKQFSSQLSGGGQSASGNGNDRLAAAFAQAQEAAQSGDSETAIAIYSQILEHIPDNADATFLLGYTLHMSGRIEEAIPMHKAATQFEQYTGIANYNLACAYALTGNAEESFAALHAAYEAGFDVVGSAPGDSDFDSLKRDKRFGELMDAFKSGPDI